MRDLLCGASEFGRGRDFDSATCFIIVQFSSDWPLGCIPTSLSRSLYLLSSIRSLFLLVLICAPSLAANARGIAKLVYTQSHSAILALLLLL